MNSVIRVSHLYFSSPCGWNRLFSVIICNLKVNQHAHYTIHNCRLACSMLTSSARHFTWLLQFPASYISLTDTMPDQKFKYLSWSVSARWDLMWLLFIWFRNKIYPTSNTQIFLWTNVACKQPKTLYLFWTWSLEPGDAVSTSAVTDQNQNSHPEIAAQPCELASR